VPRFYAGVAAARKCSQHAGNVFELIWAPVAHAGASNRLSGVLQAAFSRHQKIGRTYKNSCSGKDVNVFLDS